MLTKKEILNILSKRVDEVLAKDLPSFNLLSDMQKATSLILDAINNNKKIVVVGDYDVDGVSSSAIMKEFFDFIGYEIEIVIPNRFEDGYGLTPTLLNKIEADLIITVDNGITSFEAADICKKRGIKLIITDHHTPFINENPKSKNEKFLLPNADAIINPKTSPNFPFKEICGAEVAWYLIASIKNNLNIKYDLRELLDIVSIAIIADVMPLLNINRTLVKIGLNRLNNSQRPFVIALKEELKKDSFKSEDIAFQIAPRLNAAGRIDSAYLAFNFLTSKSLNQAKEYLKKLTELNNKRKEIEKISIENIKIDNEDFIIANGEFHEGVIGIIASRLVHKYKKPAIVFTKNGDKLKGSGRSLGNINIFSLIKECEDILEGFGGHAMACGLSIKEENLQYLKDLLNKKINIYNEDDFFIKDFVLGEIKFSEIDYELVEILNRFEPYGEGNPKPKFISKAKIESIQNIKDNHYRLTLSQDNYLLNGIIFNYDKEFSEEIEFKFSIDINNFLGNQIELRIEEIL